jgi:hypothetical protein
LYNLSFTPMMRMADAAGAGFTETVNGAGQELVPGIRRFMKLAASLKLKPLVSDLWPVL